MKLDNGVRNAHFLVQNNFMGIAVSECQFASASEYKEAGNKAQKKTRLPEHR